MYTNGTEELSHAQLQNLLNMSFPVGSPPAGWSVFEYQAPELTPNQIKLRLVLDNNGAYNSATAAITADYPQLEKDTWPTQDKESKAWVADPDNALTPWIDRAAAIRGIEREEYLRRTLAKAWQFEVISAYLTGTRQKYEDLIKGGGAPSLDYSIPPEIYAEMQAQSMQIMTTPAADLQGLF
jgi:hypothetical protein